MAKLKSPTIGFQLPTFTSAEWTVTSFYHSMLKSLARDKRCTKLVLFTYAVTVPGWREISSSIKIWLRARKGREVVAYVGTDHALTEPEALRIMRNDGVQVRIMRRYHGIYHPKVVWLSGNKRHLIWVGSNNLTREGLLHNIEFATLTKTNMGHPELIKWANNVHEASEPLAEQLIETYENERRRFARERSRSGTFTWSIREDPLPKRRVVAKRKYPKPRQKTTRILLSKGVSIPEARGDLVVEIMPLETGPDGKQIQLPKEAAISFFRIKDKVGASRTIDLTPVGTKETRPLTLTLFRNKTVRLSLSELDYRDRPCVIVFKRQASNAFLFEIVQRSITPTRYKSLLKRCSHKTRQGSRRWDILN